jgi:uncharacterized protein YjbI with pentapeptide repeats
MTAKAYATVRERQDPYAHDAMRRYTPLRRRIRDIEVPGLNLLEGSSPHGVNLDGADLGDANLRSAKLDGAELRRTRLDPSILS